MLKLLGRNTSGNVQKVIFALEEIGAEYEREDYGRLFENTKTPEYMAMNPTSKVPTLVDGDLSIWESNTILRYLAATRAPHLTGADPAEKTQVERWMDFQLNHLAPGYVTAFKGSKQEPADRPAGFDDQIKELHATMQVLNGHLEGKSHFALGRLTIADMAYAPLIARCLGFSYERPAMPALEAWMDGIKAMPAFQKATG